MQYDDPNAAHSAPKFFNGQALKGSQIKVQMAEVKEYVDYGGGRGGRGGG